MVKNLPANAGDVRNVGSIPGLGRFSCSRKWQPFPVFLPGKSHGQRSLEGYSPWGHKQLDMTEQTHRQRPYKLNTLYLSNEELPGIAFCEVLMR